MKNNYSSSQDVKIGTTKMGLPADTFKSKERCANCGEEKGLHLVKNNMRDLMCPNPTTENQRFKADE